MTIPELAEAQILQATALWAACGLTRPWNDPIADARRALDGETSTILATCEPVTGTVIGTVMAGLDGHRGWIYYLAVDPAQRRCGLGRALVAAAEEWLGARGAPKVQLMVRASNATAVGFYRDLGYVDQEVTVLGRFLDPALERLRTAAP